MWIMLAKRRCIQAVPENCGGKEGAYADFLPRVFRFKSIGCKWNYLAPRINQYCMLKIALSLGKVLNLSDLYLASKLIKDNIILHNVARIKQSCIQDTCLRIKLPGTQSLGPGINCMFHKVQHLPSKEKNNLTFYSKEGHQNPCSQLQFQLDQDNHQDHEVILKQVAEK